jgi:hypothetical protein
VRRRRAARLTFCLKNIPKRAEDRGSRVLASGAEADALWATLVTLAQAMDGEFSYKAFSLTTVSDDPTINYNAFIGSLLYQAGIEIEGNEPFGDYVAPARPAAIAVLHGLAVRRCPAITAM